MHRSDFLERIRANIASLGYHVTVVTGGALPRYAYTIGCTATVGAEFVLAGGEAYSLAQVEEILAACVSRALHAPHAPLGSVRVGVLGSFSLVRADASWSKQLLLGAFDYYQQTAFEVWQVVPDAPHRTREIPDMFRVFAVADEPVWQWLARPWAYPVPEDAMAVTHVPVLMGEHATEVVRWETDEWEIFAGAGLDVPTEEKRIVPLGVLLGLDSALERAVPLAVGKGLWREAAEGDWHDWE